MREIVSAKGSRFLLCKLAQSDARFAKYPPQPVVGCEGYRCRFPGSATLRDERAGDAMRIRQVHGSAFPTEAEATLVDALRRAGRLSLSLLAEVDGELVGHLALSPVTGGASARGLGLAPVAVLPAFQNRGVGSALIREALARCRRLDVGYVVVLGHPDYYGRFGFLPASTWNLSDEYGGGDAFQAIELAAGAIGAVGGRIQYAPEFAAL